MIVSPAKILTIQPTTVTRMTQLDIAAQIQAPHSMAVNLMLSLIEYAPMHMDQLKCTIRRASISIMKRFADQRKDKLALRNRT